VSEPSDDLPRFSNGRVDPYGGRLLPICCPDAPSLTFGTTIRIARSRPPSCMSGRSGDLRFLGTISLSFS
jgi:hypothetical protein